MPCHGGGTDAQKMAGVENRFEHHDRARFQRWHDARTAALEQRVFQSHAHQRIARRHGPWISVEVCPRDLGGARQRVPGPDHDRNIVFEQDFVFQRWPIGACVDRTDDQVELAFFQLAQQPIENALRNLEGDVAFLLAERKDGARQ